MKKILFIGLVGAMILTACGSDEKEFVMTDGKVDVAKAIEFKVDFDDFNIDEEVEKTRIGLTNNDTISKQYINLDNHIMAEVVVQKDTTKATTKTMTRTLDNDTYTMLAYQGGVYKDEITGTVSGGKFTYTGKKAIHLVPGTYDFILFNNKVTRSGNTLTVAEENAETALIGRTTYTVTTTAQQQVSFQMKHCGIRLRLQWISYMPIVNLQGYLWSNSSTASTTYDIAAGTWAEDAPGTGKNTIYTGGTSSDANGIYRAISNYVYYLPKVGLSEMRIQRSGGTTYNGASLLGAGPLLPTTLPREANGSYIVTFKLMYNYLYLMSDGTTGLFTQTTYGGGTQKPVGVVLSRSKRLAAALNAAPRYWHNLPESAIRTNDGLYERLHYEPTFSDMNGYHYTWERNYSADYFSGTSIKANNSYFPAFRYVAQYNNELASRGIYLSGTLSGKKWHLGSTGEWAYIYTLGFGNKALLNNYWTNYAWQGGAVNTAFTQVGGTSIYSHHWASTEIKNGYGNYSDTVVSMSPLEMHWSYQFSDYGQFLARPFIYY